MLTIIMCTNGILIMTLLRKDYLYYINSYFKEVLIQSPAELKFIYDRIQLPHYPIVRYPLSYSTIRYRPTHCAATTP